MNTQLKSLKQQAYIKAVELSKEGEHLCSVGSNYFNDLYEQLFAEAILKKCIKLVEDYEDRRTFYRASDMLSQYFDFDPK